MRVLTTGSAGMLGAAVIEELARESQYEVVATGRSVKGHAKVEMDIRNWPAVRQAFSVHKPDLVVHMAAETNVDRCELEPEHGYACNAFGTENIVRACVEVGATMVYISTANVFSGDKDEPYHEYDVPGSINVYGRSKLAGERIVEQALSNYYIFRAGWMVGGWDIDKKFVRKIAQLCSEQDELKVVDDTFGSLTFTTDFASQMMKVVGSGLYGLYHLANKGTASRWEIALEIVDAMGRKEDVKVQRIPSDQFPLPAPRPRSEMLNNFKLDLLDMDSMPYWKDALHAYIKGNKGRL